MLGFEDYRKIIADSLFENGIISERLYEKCKKPSYISGLPGDLRTTDVNVLRERMETIEDEISRREDIIDKANYRIGVKTRDSERLSKRVEKNISNMDKAVDNINKESDKIVKNITGLEKKLDKVDFTGNGDLKKSIDSRLKDFKKRHNNLFDDDLTGENIKEYTGKVKELSNASIELNNILQEAFNQKLINKSDLGKSDISKVIARIDKNIDKYSKGGLNVSKDVQSISDNQKDIDYIVSESNTVIKEIEDLTDEFVATHNKYMEHSNAPYRSSTPNPQMMIDIDARKGDNFTFLPPNYEVYMV